MLPFTTISKNPQGCAPFGKENAGATRIHTIPDAQVMIDTFTSLNNDGDGFNELDTAQHYGLGSSEEVCIYRSI